MIGESEVYKETNSIQPSSNEEKEESVSSAWKAEELYLGLFKISFALFIFML